ncbi:ABC transporter ATP-binding protein [Micromonospora sp. HUAS LYJ1]|uniref:ABC transporter ATP-binding protein n=1 Tax=Micromonospora sp. HUAS LYJ1 TaxID=3061626 RepID=UPI002671ADDD|nr:ABC transporter ATP-binding protein [Micromonospora sp. HUAS LYJ1]WKU03352.1 ABC transporter ATP-binding protein [Micromonospora sp. HUAS LYJ1]
MAVIDVEDVSKEFQARRADVLALSRTTLRIEGNQVVCVVGPSGCGKTTLLNLIAGFLQPSAGRVLVDGSPVTRPDSSRAVVFQSDAVFPWLTVRRNVEYGLRLRGVDRTARKERVDRYLDLVGLADFADAYPKELSGGMRKRVDIARAYASGPEVLLLDEPFGALDIFTREAMWLALHHVNLAEPKTIVFVTHDIEEALFVGDRVIVMTPRPARVHQDITVPFERRGDLDLRGSKEFQDMRIQISRSLREVSGDRD